MHVARATHKREREKKRPRSMAAVHSPPVKRVASSERRTPVLATCCTKQERFPNRSVRCHPPAAEVAPAVPTICSYGGESILSPPELSYVESSSFSQQTARLASAPPDRAHEIFQTPREGCLSQPFRFPGLLSILDRCSGVKNTHADGRWQMAGGRQGAAGGGPCRTAYTIRTPEARLVWKHYRQMPLEASWPWKQKKTPMHTCCSQGAVINQSHAAQRRKYFDVRGKRPSPSHRRFCIIGYASGRPTTNGASRRLSG